MSLAAILLTVAWMYRVEIRHTTDATDTGWTDWVHIHCPQWETTDAYPDAMAYARRVRDDHPGSQIRIVETADGYPDHHIPVD